jgi:hypothetical protein
MTSPQIYPLKKELATFSALRYIAQPFLPVKAFPMGAMQRARMRKAEFKRAVRMAFAIVSVAVTINYCFTNRRF